MMNEFQEICHTESAILNCHKFLRLANNEEEFSVLTKIVKIVCLLREWSLISSLNTFEVPRIASSLVNDNVIFLSILRNSLNVVQ